MIEVATLSDDEERMTFSATDAERTALAGRLGIVALEALEAEAFVRAIGGAKEAQGARARVTFHASVVQSSVVTLEPVTSRIDESFEVEFLPRPEAEAPGKEAKNRGEEDGSEFEGTALDAPEPPGEVINGWFDLGDMIVEYLSLAIDPYPRRAGEEFGEWHDGAPADAAGGDKKEGPFAALKHWRSRA